MSKAKIGARWIVISSCGVNSPSRGTILTGWGSPIWILTSIRRVRAMEDYCDRSARRSTPTEFWRPDAMSREGSPHECRLGLRPGGLPDAGTDEGSARCEAFHLLGRFAGDGARRVGCFCAGGEAAPVFHRDARRCCCGGGRPLSRVVLYS